MELDGRAPKRLKSPPAGADVEMRDEPAPGGSAGQEEAAGGATVAGTATPTREDTRGATATEAAADRPTDLDIINWENAIREEETQKRPLIGDLESLAALESEYAAGSPVFVAKIKRLAQTYRAVRRAAGDGNCFFRSFLFAYMESLVENNDLQERNRVVTCIRQWKPKMVEAGYMELVFEDAMEVLVDQLNSLGTAEPLGVATLEANLRDPTLSPMMVMFLRMLTAAEIQRRQDFFLPFILGMSDDAVSVEQFCRRYVEPMGEESDHVHIVALINALQGHKKAGHRGKTSSGTLQVPTRVVYLDGSPGQSGGGGGEGDATSHDFVPEALAAAPGGSPPPRVTVLYRPGHYDILYPKGC